jgi:hypothetical protein
MFVHSPAAVQSVLDLAAEGYGARRISARTGIPARTVSDWLRGRTPGARGGDGCATCGAAEHRYDELPLEYVYLLGLYLGDGYIASHARDVYRLRVVLDLRYPSIIGECERAMQLVVPRNRVARLVRNDSWVEVAAYSRQWPCLFPQHGRGKKHDRRIDLTAWQRALVERDPWPLLRGLIHSDGCRVVNTGRNWNHPRYAFRNVSADIRAIFCDACELAGLSWTTSGTTIYVSRKADVARLDEFVGPKT